MLLQMIKLFLTILFICAFIGVAYTEEPYWEYVKDGVYADYTNIKKDGDFVLVWIFIETEDSIIVNREAIDCQNRTIQGLKGYKFSNGKKETLGKDDTYYIQPGSVGDKIRKIVCFGYSRL